MVHVNTALEMLQACEEAFPSADIALFSAAVADMRPAHAADHKLKKGAADADLGTITLVENPDILATLGAKKGPHQVVVGFAAETDNVIANAQAKLVKKNADVIVANRVGEGLAFGTDDNAVCFVDADEIDETPSMPKDKLADVILDHALEYLR